MVVRKEKKVCGTATENNQYARLSLTSEGDDDWWIYPGNGEFIFESFLIEMC